MRILCDLDNVLVDFDRSAARVHKLTIEQLLPHRDPEIWSMCPALSKALGREINLTDFWRPIHAEGSYFWATIPPLPWINEILAQVVDYATDWKIVTTPSSRTDSYLGKLAWAHGWFGEDFDRIHITKYKEDLANPDTVLIDDHPENIEKFIKAGGHGILFPAIGNSLHPLRSSPVPYVRNCLKEVMYAHQVLRNK